MPYKYSLLLSVRRIVHSFCNCLSRASSCAIPGSRFMSIPFPAECFPPPFLSAGRSGLTLRSFRTRRASYFPWMPRASHTTGPVEVLCKHWPREHAVRRPQPREPRLNPGYLSGSLRTIAAPRGEGYRPTLSMSKLGLHEPSYWNRNEHWDSEADPAAER